MAKKVRRVRRSARNQSDARTNKEPEKTVEEELSEEYAYVISDLRRVFIIAALLFILLIVLNLLLG